MELSAWKPAFALAIDTTVLREKSVKYAKLFDS